MRNYLVILLGLTALAIACEEPAPTDPPGPIDVDPSGPDAGPETCGSDDDCAFGQVCDGARCRPPAPEVGDDGCLVDDDCAADERCATSTGQCIPAASFPAPPSTEDGPCSAGDLRFCGIKVGACEYGVERCEDGAWSGVCEGGTGPSAEVCDGADNNCDGETDEGFTLGGACSDGLGVCQQVGVVVCTADGTATECSAVGLDPAGRVELCGNGLNDDCDAETDEGFVLGAACSEGVGGCASSGVTTCSADLTTTVCSATPSTPLPAELCGGDPDDDCDGEQEEGFDAAGDFCAAGIGGCRQTGFQVCNAARDGLQCSAVPLQPLLFEVCGDGIDNDCNPATDENVIFSDVGDACAFGTEPCTVPGTIGCAAGGLATECVPNSPVGQAETLCDGLDDDNDVCIDEDFDVGTSCSAGVGFCQRNGSKVCAADQLGTVCDVVAGQPNPLGELCGNGINDDCDGETDEGFLGLGSPCVEGVGICQTLGNFVCSADRTGIECSAVPGPPNPDGEICGNNRDDDCDGVLDADEFDVGAPCSVGLGICRRDGVKVCSADGLGTVCSATPGAPNPFGELCGNLLNDDCDGETDEGFVLGAACTSGLGICERSGFTVCAADRLSAVCDATPGPPHPDGELCGNGVNDDCDLATDEGFADLGQSCVNGLGECARNGNVVCSASLTATECNVLPGVPVGESCDNLDNDCNGTPDNGCDDDDDDFCDAALAFTASATCPLSTPALLDCVDTDAAVNPGAIEVCFDAKDQNCDGDNNDGCNCDPAIDRDFDGSNECDDCNDTNGAVRPGALELCDGVDNNCVNGIDEGFDVDGDGFTICGTLPGGGINLANADCDDTSNAVFPGACELCNDAANNPLLCGDVGTQGNLIDEDCDGFLDENCAPCDNVDDDGDGLSECAGDCDDTEPTVAPGNTELCDGLDTDCNKNTTDNCVVGDDCDHPDETDECEDGLLCVQSLGGGGNPTGNFTCTSLCNFSELGLGLEDGCAANQICGAALTPSANQHGCQVATDIGATLAGGTCSRDDDCRSSACLNDPRTAGPPDRFCDDFCGSDAYCANGAKCQIVSESGRCFPVLGAQDRTFNDTCDPGQFFECDAGQLACIEFAAGDNRCTDVCCTGTDCAAGFHCGVEGRGAPGPIGGVDTVPVCFPDSAGNGGRQAGAACASNAQCASEFCDANLGVCVDVCCNDATCPAGLTCEDTLMTVDLQNISGQTFARVCVNQTPADPLEKLP